MEDCKTSADCLKKSSSLPVGDGVRAALAHLKRAFDCAKDAQVPPWDFALEIGQLYAAGLTITDLRWMAVKNFVELADETTMRGDEHRSFTPSRGLKFLPTTCALLTLEGARLAERENAAPPDEVPGANGKWHARLSVRPHWDATRRALFFGGQLVKQFQAPARNQELILSSFQKEHWPAFIHDPLADEFDVDPKIRLNDVVYRLNRRQRANLLRFHVNGLGHCVHWSLRAPAPLRHHPRAAVESLAAMETRAIDG